MGLRASSLHHKQKGFTLIEMLIAIAIVSLLTRVAVPNLIKFRNRARQTEAKANLANLYVAEKSFQSEWNGFTGDFRDIGYSIAGRLNYDVGFAGPGWIPSASFTPASSALCGPRLAYNTEVSACALEPGSSQATVIFQPAVATATCGAAQNPTTTSFRATAIGVLSGPPADVWTIDQDRTLCNNVSGL